MTATTESHIQSFRCGCWYHRITGAVHVCHEHRREEKPKRILTVKVVR